MFYEEKKQPISGCCLKLKKTIEMNNIHVYVFSQIKELM